MPFSRGLQGVEPPVGFRPEGIFRAPPDANRTHPRPPTSAPKPSEGGPGGTNRLSVPPGRIPARHGHAERRSPLPFHRRARLPDAEDHLVMELLPIAIIADDLTGAADTAAAFARAGRPVPVSLNERPVLSEGAAAFAVTTESRAAAPEAALDMTAAAARGVLAAGAGLIYKKVDSNLRGNIGAELAALYDVARRPILLAPAFPARGRTTVNGVVLISGVPASETEMARDPEAPLLHSGIAEIIHSQRPDLPVGHLSRGDLPITAIDLSRRITETPILIADAATDADLDLIAEAALAMNPPPIFAGSAGLASALCRILINGGGDEACRDFLSRPEGPCGKSEQRSDLASGAVPKPVPNVPKGVPGVPLGVPSVPKSVPAVPFVPPPAVPSDEQGGPVLAVLASSSQSLARQVALAAEEGIDTIPFPCERLSWAEETIPELGEAIAHAVSVLRDGRDAIVYAAGPLPAIERPVDLVVEHLAHLSYAVTKQAHPNALLVGGGATAHAVLVTLGVSAIQIDAEPLPGIAAGVTMGGHFSGRPVVLKPGAAGDETALITLIRYLRHRGVPEEQN